MLNMELPGMSKRGRHHGCSEEGHLEGNRVECCMNKDGLLLRPPKEAVKRRKTRRSILCANQNI